MLYIWGRNVGVQEGEPEGKKPFGRHEVRWQEYIEMNLNVGWEDLDWITLARSIDK